MNNDTPLSIVAPEEIDLSGDRLQDAYDLLERWTHGDEAPLPGAALLVGRHGRLIEPRFFGKQGPEARATPIRRDGMFLMASITKPVVYMAGLMLVERGLMNLTDRVTRYIPEFAAHHKEETLILHLFTHTSGMPDMLPNNEELRRQHAPLKKFTEGAIAARPLFPPGTDLSYQSMGTLVVSEIIERISGEPIDQFLKKEIFQPLGMESTALGSRGLDRERLVRVEVPDFQHGTDFGWNSIYWQQLGAPWGGLFSTPEDFARICQLLLNGGELNGVRLLSPNSVAAMTTNRLNDLPLLPEAVRRSRPWGLGWRLNHRGHSDSWGDLLSSPTFGHTGATGTMCWIDPDRDAFCLILTSGLRAKAPWRLVHVSNAVAASIR